MFERRGLGRKAEGAVSLAEKPEVDKSTSYQLTTIDATILPLSPTLNNMSRTSTPLPPTVRACGAALQLPAARKMH